MKIMRDDRVCEYDNIVYQSDDDKLIVSSTQGYMHFQYNGKNNNSIYSSDYVEMVSILISDNYMFDNNLLSLAIDSEMIDNNNISYDRVFLSILYGTNILDKVSGNLDDVLLLLRKKFGRTINSLYASKSVKDVRSKLIKKLNIAIIYEYLLHMSIL